MDIKRSIRTFSALVCAVGVQAVSVTASFCDESFRYSVVGTVKALPGGPRASNEILVKHQEIPDYRDSSGKVVGMMAMTMPFYLSPKVSVSDIKVGDAVTMVVEQRLTPRFTEEVVEIKRAE